MLSLFEQYIKDTWQVFITLSIVSAIYGCLLCTSNRIYGFTVFGWMTIIFYLISISILTNINFNF